ncbi:hypothetical protein E2C11_12160 [Streptomyces lavendulae]|nr:hypothetical protein [Streptomyces lavendulae]TXJ79360.1 hypothetical protein E2C11_12160 [Streptomyces lavendulae]
MGRVGGRFARVQVSSRLTWTFSARAVAGRARPRRQAPVCAAGVPVTRAVLRSVLRAVRGRPPAAVPRTARVARLRRGRMR